MTGRELIIYILENGLENEDIFKDGKIIGLKSTIDVAEECNVGINTVHAWIKMNKIPYVKIGDYLFVPSNYKAPIVK